MNNKNRILFISHSSFFNGAEICLLTLVKTLNRDLFEPIVVFPNAGPLEQEIKLLNVKTYITPLERWIRYKSDEPVQNIDFKNRVQRITEIIEKESINIVHTNTSVVIEGAVAAKIRNVPHVWHIHEYLKDNTEFYPCLPLPLTYAVISCLSEKIISVSGFVKGQFEPIINIDKISTIYNGVEKNRAEKNDNLLKKNFGIDDNGLIAVTVGILSEAKGYLNLLESASIVRDRGYPVKFFWVGGSDKKTLRDFKSKVKKFGLKDSVFYLGFRKDIPEILKCSDLLICASTMETLSLAILEAMAAGLPVITTNCGGPSECVEDGLTGFIVPVNDPARLSEKINEISSDSQLRKRLGENGLRLYLSKFRADLYNKNFEDLYSKIIKDKKSETISVKEEILTESFLELYQGISEHHWKRLKKMD